MCNPQWQEHREPQVVQLCPILQKLYTVPAYCLTLVVSLRNMRAGRMVQTQEPMVLPTKPSTNSMSGTRIPMVRQIKITPPVIMLNLKRMVDMFYY